MSTTYYSAHSSVIRCSLPSFAQPSYAIPTRLARCAHSSSSPPPDSSLLPHRWTAGYFASIKFFEQKVEQAIKLVKGKDFDVKKDQGAVVFAQLVSGD